MDYCRREPSHHHEDISFWHGSRRRRLAGNIVIHVQEAESEQEMEPN